MNVGPELLLIGAVAAVGVLHTIVPDHWVPITLIARQRGWSKVETARASLQAGIGHVLSTLWWWSGLPVSRLRPVSAISLIQRRASRRSPSAAGSRSQLGARCGEMPAMDTVMDMGTVMLMTLRASLVQDTVERCSIVRELLTAATGPEG
jgi:hypothetical protein